MSTQKCPDCNNNEKTEKACDPCCNDPCCSEKCFEHYSKTHCSRCGTSVCFTCNEYHKDIIASLAEYLFLHFIKLGDYWEENDEWFISLKNIPVPLFLAGSIQTPVCKNDFINVLDALSPKNLETINTIRKMTLSSQFKD